MGAGAYASVYAVTQAQGEARRCAAKVVGSGSSGSQTTAEMAAREVEILRKAAQSGACRGRCLGEGIAVSAPCWFAL